MVFHLLASGHLPTPTPCGGTHPLQKVSGLAVALSHKTLRRRCLRLSPILAVGPSALPCAGADSARNVPSETTPRSHAYLFEEMSGRS